MREMLCWKNRISSIRLLAWESFSGPLDTTASGARRLPGEPFQSLSLLRDLDPQNPTRFLDDMLRIKSNTTIFAEVQASLLGLSYEASVILSRLCPQVY